MQDVTTVSNVASQKHKLSASACTKLRTPTIAHVASLGSSQHFPADVNSDNLTVGRKVPDINPSPNSDEEHPAGHFAKECRLGRPSSQVRPFKQIIERARLSQTVDTVNLPSAGMRSTKIFYTCTHTP